MPVYAYRGVAAGNRSTRGMVNADSVRSARAQLRAEGIFPTELVETRARGVSSELLARLSLPHAGHAQQLTQSPWHLANTLGDDGLHPRRQGVPVQLRSLHPAALAIPDQIPPLLHPVQ